MLMSVWRSVMSAQAVCLGSTALSVHALTADRVLIVVSSECCDQGPTRLGFALDR